MLFATKSRKCLSVFFLVWLCLTPCLPVWASPNSDLWRGLVESSPETVNLALRHGADPNNASKGGYLPLFMAIQKNEPQVVKQLLDYQANPNARWNELTPLMFATEKKRTDLMRLLLDRGADPNARSSKSRTSLILAIVTKRLATVKLLLERRADPNLADDEGNTPLIWAALSGDTSIFKAILSSKADVHIADKDRHSALSVARKKNLREIVLLLQAAGAKD